MDRAGRDTKSGHKKAWVKPDLKNIAAGSAEADVGGDIKDGANASAKS